MASSVTPLFRTTFAAEATLERVKGRVLAQIGEATHLTTFSPDLCIYRFCTGTSIEKRATFGVTLGVVLQGTKHLSIDGHALVVERGQLLVITRALEHTTMTTVGGPSGRYLGFSLTFSPERVARALLSITEAGAPSPPETVPAFVMPCDAAISGALERLVMTLDDPLEGKLLAPLFVEEILFRLLRSDAAAAVRGGVAHAADAGRILESMRYIREHHTEKLTVEGLAKGVAMSPSHYAHRFSAVARVSPMRFVREVRLDQARALLVESGARTSEVASRVGFESPAHFAREFKRRYGVPPSRYGRPDGADPR
ncbi:MAG: AraC family transcriptional regulator [Deltaproteobacteria bacterium]|nr:AraC family transcriptional regulator [Deltaproteobacteria bacterium]